jgi:hypothetical protein
MQNDTAIDTTVQPRRFGLRRIRRLARFLSQRTIPAQPKGFTLDPTSRLEPPAGASTYFVSLWAYGEVYDHVPGETETESWGGDRIMG